MGYERVARLSIMLSPRSGLTGTELGRSVVALKPQMASLMGAGTHVRVGTRCENDPLSHSMGESRPPTPVEVALEITGGDGSERALAAGAKELGLLLTPMIEVSSAALTVGPTYRMVEPRDGAVFLSLSFKRHPGTTVEQFREWWLTQHAKVAIPRLPGLLAYDQVHVDHELSRHASAAAKLPYVPYDSYDNLTWASSDAFIRSTSNPRAMQEVYEDEVGHIDHGTYRGSLMNQAD